MLKWALRWFGVMDAAERQPTATPRSVNELLETAAGIAWDHSRSMAHPDAELVMQISEVELQALEDEFLEDGPLNYMVEKDADGVHIVTTLYGVRLVIVSGTDSDSEDWL